MTKFEIYCDTGITGDKKRKATISIDDLGYSEEQWSNLNSDEMQKVLDDYVVEWLGSFMSFGWEEVE